MSLSLAALMPQTLGKTWGVEENLISESLPPFAMGETKTSLSLVKIAWKVPPATEFCLAGVEKLWLNITIGGVE
ncbi:hypothetical protein MKX08_008278 [Trichoderma sp. CBMAI-0020]|nr:hypothetical protein MKX08_008278 [Trichoderma sp. CBMAI-0020]